jgi:hypothetical protein
MSQKSINDEWEEQEGNQYWKPTEKGEEIQGEIVGVRESTYGSVYDIKQQNGEVITTSSYKALLARLSQVKIGDEVKIVYDGEDLPKQKGYKPTKLFKVYIRKA